MITEIRSAAGADKGFFNCFDGYGVLRDHWDADLLDRVADAFPSSSSATWEEVQGRHERMAVLHDKTLWGSAVHEFVDLLGGDAFVQMLSELSGIEGLVIEPDSAALQLMCNDDYEDLHAGPNLSKAGWRRLRVQTFLTRHDDALGGSLRVYDNPEPFAVAGSFFPAEGQRVMSVTPGPNVTAVFETAAGRFYGQPEPLWGPRPCKSVVAYYCAPGLPNGNVFASNRIWWRT